MQRKKNPQIPHLKLEKFSFPSFHSIMSDKNRKILPIKENAVKHWKEREINLLFRMCSTDIKKEETISDFMKITQM